MADKGTLKSAQRRAFFKKAGIGIGAAGVAAAGLSGTAAAAGAESGPKDRKAAAYQETDHVKQAYRTARF